MKKIISIIFVMMLLITGVSVSVNALKINNSILTLDDGDDELDQYNEISNFAAIQADRGEYSFAQSFTPTYNILTRVELWRNAFNTGLRDVKLTIRSDINGNNIVMPIYVKPDDCWHEWLEFDIPDLQVVPGETYYLVWKTMGGGTNGNHGSDENPYPNGNAYGFGFWAPLGEWVSKNNWDFCFKTYGRNGNEGNTPPEIPVLIEGITEGKVGIEYDFKFSSGDVNGDNIKYRIKSNENSFSNDNSYFYESDIFESDEIGDFKVKFDTPAVYFLEVIAVDELGSESTYSLDLDPIFISDNQNTEPMKPELIADDFANYYKKYECSAVTWDCDKNQIFYKFDWGDETESEWLGPYDNGEECIAEHIWKGGFMPEQKIIKVKAKDIHGTESEWSESQEVFLDKRSKTLSNTFLGEILERFPILSNLFFF